MSVPSIFSDTAVHFQETMSRTQWGELVGLLQGNYQYIVNDSSAPNSGVVEPTSAQGLFGLERALYGRQVQGTAGLHADFGTSAAPTSGLVYDMIRDFASGLDFLEAETMNGNIPMTYDSGGSLNTNDLRGRINILLGAAGADAFRDAVRTATTDAELLTAYQNSLGTTFAGVAFPQLMLIYDALLPGTINGGSASIIDVEFSEAVQDMVNFEYARAGEAGLNRVLGQLGDELQNLNEYITHLNTIDSIISQSTLEVDFEGKLSTSSENGAEKLTARFEDLFDALTSLTEMAQDGKLSQDQQLKVREIQDSMMQFYSLPIFPGAISPFTGDTVLYWKTTSGSDPFLQDTFNKDTSGSVSTGSADHQGSEYAADATAAAKFTTAEGVEFFDFDATYFDGGEASLKEGIDAYIRDKISNYTSFDWQSGATAFTGDGTFNPTTTGGPPTGSDLDDLVEETFKHNMANWFGKSDIQTTLSQSLTQAQTLNDTAKQQLKKTMFIYQEFVKSAGTVMERLHQITNGLAQKISR